MNKKSQGFVAGLMLFAVFIIIWLGGLGAVIGSLGASMAAGQTGIWAFVLTYLNIWIFIGCVMGILLYTGGSG